MTQQTVETSPRRVARSREMSPRVKARMADLLYLIKILAGVFTQGVIAARVVVAGDAAATAANCSHDR